MANVIAYEELSVTNVAVGPLASRVTTRARCAVFYVDPNAKSSVRWRPLSGSNTDPSGFTGFPLRPGKMVSVAGEGVIRNSRFILDGATDVRSVKVYALYFDQVDVVLADFADDGSTTLKEIAETQKEVKDYLRQIRDELNLHSFALHEAIEQDLEPVEREN